LTHALHACIEQQKDHFENDLLCSRQRHERAVMIRGSIEIVSPELVQGWIHIEHAVVRDRVVLAFCGDECVGSGTVNMFRDDLAGAGVGDGFVGFAIRVDIDEDSAPSVVVRLDGCDAVLLQNGASVWSVNHGVKRPNREAVVSRLMLLKWALRHARISQADFDFQRILWSLGVYERGLVHRQTGEEALVFDDPSVVAATLLESYAAQNVEIETVIVRDDEDFKRHIAKSAGDPNLVPVIGVHAKDITWLRVLEGSQVAGATFAVDSDGNPQYAVYTLKAEYVLLLDARVLVDLRFPSDIPSDVFIVRARLSS